MAKVNVCNVVVLENPSKFLSPFQFEITFECFENLPDDLEWKLTYVGSAETEAHDQVLDSVLVGPVPEGRHMFVFSADPPDVKKIPPTEAVGVTVALLSCSYKSQEFVKIGYFVSNDYTDAELKENPPSEPRFDLLQRFIVFDQPRVTVKAIKWGDEPTEEETAKEEPVNTSVHSENDIVVGNPDGVKSFMSQSANPIFNGNGNSTKVDDDNNVHSTNGCPMETVG